MNPKDYSPLALAYIGDAHYNMTVKKFVITREVRMNLLQKHANRYVSALKQAEFMDHLLKNGLLSEEEIEIYKWGRNSKSHKAPKNTDAVAYHVSTGFETLWGSWYLKGDETRMEQIWDIIRTYEGE